MASVVRCCALGLLVFVGLPVAVSAQDSTSRFVTGDCPRRGPAPDLMTVVGAPDSAPVLRGKTPKTPRFALKTLYSGRVLVAFVVDTRGRVERSTAVVLESNDPQLSEWICTQVESLRFRPAFLGNEPVRAQAVMPFQFTSIVPGRR